MVIRKSQELDLSTCIQLRMIKRPSRKVMNFRHLLGCDTIEGTGLEIALLMSNLLKYANDLNAVLKSLKTRCLS